MTQFVLLDTNILFRYVTQGEPGCEQEHFDALKEMVESGKVMLFNSEVEEHEFAGECKGLEEQLKSESRKIDEKVSKAIQGVIADLFPPNNKPSDDKGWNENKDVQPWLHSQITELSKRIHEWHNTKLSAATQRIANVKTLMALPGVKRLAFDHDIVVRTKRRFMEKRFKQVPKEAKPEADYNMLDSVVRYFESAERFRVLLCSENKKHLALEVDGTQFLHPTIKDDFPDGSALFLSLADLVKFIHEQKPIVEPSADKVQEAVEKESSTTKFDAVTFRRCLDSFAATIGLFQTIQRGTFRNDSLSRDKLSHVIKHLHTVLDIGGQPFFRSSAMRDALNAVSIVANQFRVQDFAQVDGLHVDFEVLIAECAALDIMFTGPNSWIMEFGNGDSEDIRDRLS